MGEGGRIVPGDGNERGHRKRQAERGPGVADAIPGFLRIFGIFIRGKRGKTAGEKGGKDRGGRKKGGREGGRISREPFDTTKGINYNGHIDYNN